MSATMQTVSIGKKPNPVTLTDVAAAKVAELLAEEDTDGLALRVAVRPGGCSGFSYEMFFDADVAEDDVVREFGDGQGGGRRRPAPTCSRARPSTTATGCRAPGSTSPTPTPPAPAAAAPPSADPADPLIRLRVDGADVEVADDGSTAARGPARAAGHPVGQGRLQPPGPVRLLHGLGGRRPPGGLRDPGPPGGRPGGHHPRGPARREPRDAGPRPWWPPAAASAGSARPGIVMRLAALEGAGRHRPTRGQVDQALLAHLCRCTGWQTIGEAARVGARRRPRPAAPPWRAGTSTRRVDPGRHRGRGPPAGRSGRGAGRRRLRRRRLPRPTPWWPCPTAGGGYAVAETVAEARALAGKVQGRSTSLPLRHPVDGARRATGRSPSPPPGWSRPTWSPTPRGALPGGAPASPFGNGGAFGGKLPTHRWPRTPAGWPTSTAARSGCCGRVRTWSGWARSGRRWPAGSTADGHRACSVSVCLPERRGRGGGGRRWWPPVAAVAPGLALEPVPLIGPPGLLRPAGRGVGRGRRAGRRRPGTRGPRAGGPPATWPWRWWHPPGGRAVARCLPDGSLRAWWWTAGDGPRRGGAPLVLHRGGPPGPGLGPVGGDRRGRRRRGPGPDHAVVRHPAGPGHAPDRRRRRVRHRPTGRRAGQRLRRRVRRGGRGPVAGRRAGRSAGPPTGTARSGPAA